MICEEVMILIQLFLVVLLSKLWIIEASIYDIVRDNNGEKSVLTNGFEFNSISRATLLKILSAFEERITNHALSRKLMPVVTADFDNNKYTKPHIYPTVYRQAARIKATKREHHYLTSVLILSSPLGSIFSGLLMDRFGRRLAIVLCEIPLAIGWLYTGFSFDSKSIIIGRIITGFGVGMAVSPPRIYGTEICLPNMRAVIGSLPHLAISLGITIQALLGAYFNWRVLCYVSALYSIVLFFINWALPETPYFMLMKGNTEDALASLRKFRAADHDIDSEMDEMIEFKNDNDIRRLSLGSKSLIFFSPSACKPFYIIMIYVVIAQASGVNAVVFWALDMLQESKSSVDPYLGNVILGVTRLLSGVLLSVILFSVGIRTMTLISGLGVGLSAITLGVYIIHSIGPIVLPQICITIYTASAALGYYSLPMQLMSEIYPLQIRGLMSGFTLSLSYMSMFVSIESYPFLRDELGFSYVAIMYGVCSLLGCIFLYFRLPETKGLTLQDIEEYYNQRRSTLFSQRRVKSLQILESEKSQQAVHTVRSKTNLYIKNSSSGEDVQKRKELNSKNKRTLRIIDNEQNKETDAMKNEKSDKKDET